MAKIQGNFIKQNGRLVEIPKGLMEEKYVSEPSMITDADPATKTFTGYAAVFGNKDLDDDITMPGAFKKSIAENGPNGTNTILCLNQHITWQVLCKPKVLQEDSKGLYYEAQVTSGATFAEDAVKLIAAGLVEENSFGFQTVKSAIIQPDAQDYDTWYRELLEVNLYEISPVTWGANPQARMQGMKSKTKEDLEIRMKKLVKALKEPSMMDETYRALEIEIKQINTEYYNLGTKVSLEEKEAAEQEKKSTMTCPNCKGQFEEPEMGDEALTGDEVECPSCKCSFMKSTSLILSRKGSLLSGVAGLINTKSTYSFNF